MENGFVDCHCHISAHEFEEDCEDVIRRTREAGVKTLVAVTEAVGEFARVLQLHERYPDLVAPCFGIHPLQAGGGPHQRSVKPQDLDAAVLQFYNHRERLVAVGEAKALHMDKKGNLRLHVMEIAKENCNFTYKYTGFLRLVWTSRRGAPPAQQDRDDQMTVFIKQLSIAKELDLPVNVHSRSAAAVTIETMREQGVSRALLHNFAGKPSVALEGVKAGYFFSFPPAVCRSRQRDRLIKQIPLEHICLETDSPALGLDKHVRNEPSNIVLPCSYIAGIKGVSTETVQLITTQNAYRLFPKAKTC